MVYLPLEAVVSKWFGEGEQKLAEVFEACEELGSGESSESGGGEEASIGPGGGARRQGVLLFLDEVDALACSREGSSMHDRDDSKRFFQTVLDTTPPDLHKGASEH